MDYDSEDELQAVVRTADAARGMDPAISRYAAVSRLRQHALQSRVSAAKGVPLAKPA